MDRRTLKYELQKINGSMFITRGEVAKAMGYKDPHYVDKYLVGLDRVGKKYFIPDVAGALIEAMNL